MAKAIMIQGTMSNAGKSLLVAGLCRVFTQDGYRVAPFKSQNMALNSYITEEGLEMGRAQVMQAEAAGRKPDVRMNPILLKPTNDTGSQVIVNGEVLGNMSAKDYYQKKLELVPDIMKAYHSLEEECDIIVIEGAGSPAEINLKQDDIVNMGMAKLANAPVLLVGDIDRGGVFAQLLGTMICLEEDEKERVKAFIINKFRGDKTILQPGLDMLYEKSGVPIAGVMPYIYVDVDDEDSLTERFDKKSKVGAVDIVVIRTPRISNFTDFNVLESMEGVSLRYVKRVSEVGKPDMVILPGTKNTIADLLWLRESGLEARIKQLSAEGKIVFGICGGYQMLGKRLLDPMGIEHQGEVEGLGLLPIQTTFTENKTRTRVKGSFKNATGILKNLNGLEFEGYEIHMGESDINNQYMNIVQICQGDAQVEEKSEGTCKGNVYGTYVHGIFDADAVAATLIATIMEAKGLDSSQVIAFDRRAYKEKQYDILAEAVRRNLDMDMVYEILNESEDK